MAFMRTGCVLGIIAGLLAAGAAGAEEPGVLSADQIARRLSRSKSITGQAKVDLPSVTFEFNSARLTPQAQRQLDELAKALTYPAFKDLPFMVAGHTDAKGSDSYNQALSEKRAASVREYLSGHQGFAERPINAVGYGESRLIPDLPPTAPEQRRVEIRLDR